MMLKFFEWLVSHLSWKALEKSIEKLRRYIPSWRNRASKDWISRLNEAFSGEVRIYCQTSQEPVLHIEGEYQLTDSQKEKAAKQREVLKHAGRPNVMHALLVEEPKWLATPVHMHVQTIDYAGIFALRYEGGKPQVLSSNALILSHELGQILLHRRRTSDDKYHSHLHIIGGGYMPPSNQGRDDGESLRATAEREVLEETKLALPPEAAPSMILAKEIATGFIQLVYLGFDMPAIAVSRVKGNWEGHVEAFPYAALPGLLQQPDWVPSGKAHVLAWLALGAPGGGEKPRFGSLSPDQLFNAWV
jgi:ADP-ribose pyrophosphatase YjhB (NUDIX family)